MGCQQKFSVKAKNNRGGGRTAEPYDDIVKKIKIMYNYKRYKILLFV